MNFDPNPDNFDWDEGNAEKNLKHEVTSDEIKSILDQSGYFLEGRIVEPERGEWRGLILGQTFSDRHLTLIFTRRAGKLRPISCRPMRIDERRRYEAHSQEQA